MVCKQIPSNEDFFFVSCRTTWLVWLLYAVAWLNIQTRKRLWPKPWSGFQAQKVEKFLNNRRGVAVDCSTHTALDLEELQDDYHIIIMDLNYMTLTFRCWFHCAGRSLSMRPRSEGNTPPRSVRRRIQASPEPGRYQYNDISNLFGQDGRPQVATRTTYRR